MKSYMKLMQTKDGRPFKFDGYSMPYEIVDGPYYENGDMVIGLPRAIDCIRDELQVIVEYANSLGGSNEEHFGNKFSDRSSTYRGCLELLEAHPEHKTVGDYLLHLARVDDPERSSRLEEALLRHPQQATFLRHKR